MRTPSVNVEVSIDEQKKTVYIVAPTLVASQHVSRRQSPRGLDRSMGAPERQQTPGGCGRPNCTVCVRASNGTVASAFDVLRSPYSVVEGRSRKSRATSTL